jgi:hypothetical protein
MSHGKVYGWVGKFIAGGPTDVDERCAWPSTEIC